MFDIMLYVLSIKNIVINFQSVCIFGLFFYWLKYIYFFNSPLEYVCLCD